MKKAEWAIVCIAGMFVIKSIVDVVVDIKTIKAKRSSKKES